MTIGLAAPATGAAQAPGSVRPPAGAEAAGAGPAGASVYAPTWASLDRRPVPAWYDSAKFGLFVHWGVYSVPAWAPTGAGVPVYEKYAEWYQRRVRDDSARGGPFWRFHARTYGPAARYRDFAPAFRAELWDPVAWADLFARSGARYVVLTAKHHDGFALWPSAQSPGWNSLAAGPGRDLAGELAAAVRARGLRMGFYYSLYEWYHPLYTPDTAAASAGVRRYVGEHMLPQLRDLVTRYRPSVLWTDGEWEHPSAAWRSPEFLAWLFNDGPNRGEVVVNDRWGRETRGRHGGVYTSEYGLEKLPTGDSAGAAWHKWEETRGVGGSFGYNRAEALGDYLTGRALVHLLVETVAKGGNLLLNVGPTADGRVPVIMQQRLAEVGDWLRVNGEAVYGTRRWRVSAEGASTPGGVRYTTRGDTVYAVALAYPAGGELALAAPRPGPATTVALLGRAGALRWRHAGGRLRIAVPPLSPDGPQRHAYAFRLTGVR